MKADPNAPADWWDKVETDLPEPGAGECDTPGIPGPAEELPADDADLEVDFSDGDD